MSDRVPFTVPTCGPEHEERLRAMGWNLFPYLVGGGRGSWVWCPPGEPVHISTAQPCPLCGRGPAGEARP